VERTGKASGLDLAQMQTTGAHVLHIRDGKVARSIFYWDRERAFADLAHSSEAEAPRPTRRNVEIIRRMPSRQAARSRVVLWRE
jgi:hypothetical protein